MSPEFRAGERVHWTTEERAALEKADREARTTHTWTEHTFACTSCKRVARASQEVIDQLRREQDFGDPNVTDAVIAASLDFCFACVNGEPGPEGEHVALCHGAEGVNNEPICTGPDVKTVQAREPGEGGRSFETEWCSECRATAEADGYSVVVI